MQVSSSSSPETYYLTNFSLKQLSKKMNLTPLHQAVIRGSLEEVGKCLQTASVNAVDARGWTALHHASVLGLKNIVELLLKNGADSKALTDTEGTSSELEAFTVARKKTETAIPLLWKSRETSSCSLLTNREYRDLTNSEYLFDFYMPIRCLIREWLFTTDVDDYFLMNKIKKKYEEFRKKPTRPHILAEVHVNESEEKLLSSPNLGVFASENYVPFVVVGEYLGRIGNNHSPHSRYQLADVDGRRYSNEFSRANDGFPNLVCVKIFNSHGSAIRYIFLTASHIQKGGQFCWNYGFHETKVGPYVELRPSALREYVKTMTKDDYRVLVPAYANEELIKSEVDFEKLIKIEKLRYLLSTPAAFFNLIIEGILNDEIAYYLWEEVAYATWKTIPDYAPVQLKELVKLAITHRVNFERIQVQDPGKAKKLRELVNNTLATKGILQTLALCEFHKSISSIRVLTSEVCSVTKGFFGIGRKLCSEDIGRRVVRTAPHKSGDWSYVPRQPTEEWARRTAITLLRLDHTTFMGKSAWDELFGGDRRTYVHVGGNDDNWMDLESYIKFIKSFSVDRCPPPLGFPEVAIADRVKENRKRKFEKVLRTQSENMSA